MDSTATASSPLAECFQMIVTEQKHREMTATNDFQPLGRVLIPWDLIEARFHHLRPREELDLQEKTAQQQWQTLKGRVKANTDRCPVFLLEKNTHGLLRFRGVKRSGGVLKSLGGYSGGEEIVSDANRLLSYQMTGIKDRLLFAQRTTAEGKTLVCMTPPDLTEYQKGASRKAQTLLDRNSLLDADFINVFINRFIQSVETSNILPTERLLSAWRLIAYEEIEKNHRPEALTSFYKLLDATEAFIRNLHRLTTATEDKSEEIASFTALYEDHIDAFEKMTKGCPPFFKKAAQLLKETPIEKLNQLSTCRLENAFKMDLAAEQWVNFVGSSVWLKAGQLLDEIKAYGQTEELAEPIAQLGKMRLALEGGNADDILKSTKECQLLSFVQKIREEINQAIEERSFILTEDNLPRYRWAAALDNLIQDLSLAKPDISFKRSADAASFVFKTLT